MVQKQASLWVAIGTVAALFYGSHSQASGFKLYGIVDTGVSAGHVSRDDSTSAPALSASNAGMTAGVLVGGSRWGLTGSEDLSAQWRTEFVLESGINSTNGQLEQGGKGFGRQATLSLERLGLFKLDLGLQMNLASRYFLGMDPFHGGTSQLALGTSFGNANVIRYSNLLQIQITPMRDLKLGLSYSLDAQLPATYQNNAGALMAVGPEEASFGTSQKLRIVSAGMHYQSDNVVIAAGFDKAIAPATTVTGLQYKGPTAWLLGSRYDFKRFAVSFILGQTFNGAFDGQLPGSAWFDSGLATTTPGSAIRFEDGYSSNSVFLGLDVPLPNQWRAVGSWQAMQPRGQLSTSPQTATQQVFSVALLNQISPRLTAYLYASVANNYAMVSTARSQVIGGGLAYTF